MRPHTVLRNLFEEVGWQRDLAEDPALLREELRELRRRLATWERLEPAPTGPAPSPGWLRRVARAATGGNPRPAPVAA